MRHQDCHTRNDQMGGQRITPLSNLETNNTPRKDEAHAQFPAPNPPVGGHGTAQLYQTGRPNMRGPSL